MTERKWGTTPEGFYEKALEHAKQYKGSADEKHDSQYTEKTQVSQVILHLLQAFPEGATTWDLWKVIPKREWCPEDSSASDLPEMNIPNRKRAEGTISATLSRLEADGFIRRVRCEDPDGSGGMVDKHRYGGYGVPRLVYELVPHDEREQSQALVEARKAAERARRLFIKEGEIVVSRLIKRVEQLETEQQIIRKYFDFPDWLLTPTEGDAA